MIPTSFLLIVWLTSASSPVVLQKQEFRTGQECKNAIVALKQFGTDDINGSCVPQFGFSHND